MGPRSMQRQTRAEQWEKLFAPFCCGPLAHITGGTSPCPQGPPGLVSCPAALSSCTARSCYPQAVWTPNCLADAAPFLATSSLTSLMGRPTCPFDHTHWTPPVSPVLGWGWGWGWEVNRQTLTPRSPQSCLVGLLWDEVQGVFKCPLWMAQGDCVEEGIFRCCHSPCPSHIVLSHVSHPQDLCAPATCWIGPRSFP